MSEFWPKIAIIYGILAVAISDRCIFTPKLQCKRTEIAQKKSSWTFKPLSMYRSSSGPSLKKFGRSFGPWSEARTSLALSAVAERGLWILQHVANSYISISLAGLSRAYILMSLWKFSNFPEEAKYDSRKFQGRPSEHIMPRWKQNFVLHKLAGASTFGTWFH